MTDSETNMTFEERLNVHIQMVPEQERENHSLSITVASAENLLDQARHSAEKSKLLDEANGIMKQFDMACTFYQRMISVMAIVIVFQSAYIIYQIW